MVQCKNSLQARSLALILVLPPSIPDVAVIRLARALQIRRKSLPLKEYQSCNAVLEPTWEKDLRAANSLQLHSDFTSLSHLVHWPTDHLPTPPKYHEILDPYMFGRNLQSLWAYFTVTPPVQLECPGNIAFRFRAAFIIPSRKPGRISTIQLSEQNGVHTRLAAFVAAPTSDQPVRKREVLIRKARGDVCACG
jgi:hypothetical protein